MKYYSKLIIFFLNMFSNNAFMLTQVNKIYFADIKYVNRKINILMEPNTNDNNSTNITSINTINDNFPSFYKFLATQSIQNFEASEEDNEEDNEEASEEDKEDIKADFIKFKNNIVNINKDNIIGNKFAMDIRSKKIKLLTSFSAIQWSRTWIYEMVHIKENFPAFMYQDMYKMCDFGCINVSKRFFYIGYYPQSIDERKGPYYIGAFEIDPKEREFVTRIIIQNPYYCAENIYYIENIINFKKELQALCLEATVNFKFSNLKNTSFERYYYSWLYE